MNLVIDARGTVRCLYDEAIELRALGEPKIRRGSHVEPTDDGTWTADMSPVGSETLLGPYDHRREALAAERNWLEEHWLLGTDCC